VENGTPVNRKKDTIRIPYKNIHQEPYLEVKKFVVAAIKHNNICM